MGILSNIRVHHVQMHFPGRLPDKSWLNIRTGQHNAFLKEQIGDSFLGILNTEMVISNTDLAQESKILKNKLLNYLNLKKAKVQFQPVCLKETYYLTWKEWKIL